ncbi:heparinase II/III family protein [Clostridium sp. AL.422]|uniref:heparinase II/III domain-containing protein n=1 Tax=Clostridium TaxID=1485 RepID=UPI00293DDBA8|nr:MULTISPECIES: heparinase II/III family protein [unclassified Clostridium]MDV4149803.1 heparinase II/III family protein [Clostridium sp. AL.422]
MEYKYFHKKVPKNEVTKPLIEQIEKYVDEILGNEIPQISYKSYKAFYNLGIRKDFEDIYFSRRKQLVALGLYLQFEDLKNESKIEKSITHFNELLWSISNEFSWSLAAHLSYDEGGFIGDSDKIIDLFAAETAQTLSELLIIHEDKIDKILKSHIKKQINNRIIEPFLNKTWKWERQTHNWNAVCSGCIGIIGLLMEGGEKQKLIISKVEKALEYYLLGFGDDGASLEGIGYWIYGFGYYNYYKSLKGEFDNRYYKTLKAIGNFPNTIQISENVFLPFSDVPVNTAVPTGLLSYLYKTYNIKLPLVSKISDFDFDHCFRWAHLSRNLWWTGEDILNKELTDSNEFLQDAQWMIIRDNRMFFAIKGGNNDEPHNHNDLGSFVVAINDNIVLTDLGAGLYTKGYFGEERYSYVHPRSYWHSIPLINGMEQCIGTEKCKVLTKNLSEEVIELELDLTDAYSNELINLFTRKAIYKNNTIFVEDKIKANDGISINEGFISRMPSKLINEGKIIWVINNHKLVLEYNENIFKYNLEEKEVVNHHNKTESIYRTSLISIKDMENLEEVFRIYKMEENKDE